LPQLRDMLFFPDVASAIDGLPEGVADAVPMPLPDTRVDPCRCQRILRDGNWVRLAKDDSRLMMPQLIHHEDPKFPEGAGAARVSGSVSLRMLVDVTGKPADLWLTVSRGYGLDEAAEAAARSYRFNPARYDNQPVGYELQVEVNFQID
jgi:TonB family protein